MADDEWRPEAGDMIATLLALAAEQRRPRRRPVKVVQKWLRTKRRIQEERERKATARRLAAQKGPERQRPLWGLIRPFGLRNIDRQLAVMEPGKWYGRGDVVRMVGLERYARDKISIVAHQKGAVQRRRNPAWTPIRFGEPAEPLWLYRLTPYGEAWREAVLLVQ
jgi:hypothetical protein